MKNISILVLFIGVLLAGCEKIDPFAPTNIGNNVLAFRYNGTAIQQDGFANKRDVTATLQDNDTLAISAHLTDSYISHITIYIPVSELKQTRTIQEPDIRFTYIYRKEPTKPGENGSTGWYFEYNTARAEDGTITIRHWDREKLILSGNFECRCKAPLYSGVIEDWSITDGNFDVPYKFENENAQHTP